MDDYGLKDQDFENMWSFIKKIGARSAPGLTMDRVKKTLDDSETLKKLESMIEGRKQALEKIEAEIVSAEARLETSTNTLIKQSANVEELIKKIDNLSNSVANNISKNLSNLEESTQENFKKIQEKNVAETEATKNQFNQSLTDTQKLAEENFDKFTYESNRLLGDITQKMYEEMNQHKQILKESDDMQSKLLEMTDTLKKANMFSSLEAGGADELKLIKKTTIISLLSGIAEWSRLMKWQINSCQFEHIAGTGKTLYFHQKITLGETLEWSLKLLRLSQ